MEKNNDAFVGLILSIILVVAILAYMAYTAYTNITSTPSLCPLSSSNKSSISPVVCGNYTMIAPAGLQAMGGKVVVYQQTGYWNPQGCIYSIASLAPKKGTRNMTLSVYNTSNKFVMILDIPTYLTNSTGRHLQYLEYDIKCG